MPTPITRLRVRLLIGQTEMFPPVTKSHHPAVKHSQSATYRFTHHSYTLTCRLHRASSGRGQRISYLNQTVLQRSNTNMWSWGPTEEEAWLTSPSQTQDYHAFTLQRASDSKKRHRGTKEEEAASNWETSDGSTVCRRQKEQHHKIIKLTQSSHIIYLLRSGSGNPLGKVSD